MKKGTSTSEIPPLQQDNKVYYMPEEKATLFNEYFIAQSLTIRIDDELPKLHVHESTIAPLMFTKEMVTKVIRGLNPNKAVGPDLVHNKILIKAVDFIAEPLSRLFTRSVNEHIFPKSWKVAHVTPIFKKGEKDVCKNYRPVSLLSCVGKVMERCVQMHVFDYLNVNNLLVPCQSGFLPCDSTVFQLLAMYNDFCQALDKRITSQTVFFDISKAFDRVWHKGLIHKLHCIGIRGSLLNWFTDY